MSVNVADVAPPTRVQPGEVDEAATRLEIIRKAGLHVDDPETIPGLMYPIPAGMEPVRLLMGYDTSKSTGRKVRCAACQHHQPHNRGFVAEMPGGQRSLIGIVCGEKHYDGQWEHLSAGLRQQQDEVYYEARVLPALTQIVASYERACALKGLIEPIEDEWRRMRVVLPELHSLIQIACAKNEGWLDRYVRRKVHGVGRDGKATESHEVSTVRFGRVPAPRAFLHHNAIHDLQRAVGALRTAKLQMEKNADTRSRKEAFLDLAKGRRMAEAVAEQVEGYHRNANMAWWQGARDLYVAEAYPGRLTIEGRTVELWDGWSSVSANILPCPAEHVARAQELVATWPGQA